MKIERVYLAGGINGLSDGDATDWRTEAKRFLPRDIAVIDPMSRDYRGKEDQNVDAIVEGDKNDINRCQAIIAMCPRPSWGTAMEIGWNHEHREIREFHRWIGEYGEQLQGYECVGVRLCVAVVPSDTPVSPWLRYHTDAVVGSVQEAAARIVAWSE